MKLSPELVRVWMPAFILIAAGLFLWNEPFLYWLVFSPLLLLVIFLVTLAEVHDDGQQIVVKRLWKSTHIPKEEVLETGKSFLDGIGVLRLRRFALPWGRIYFVHEWSTRESPEEDASGILGVLWFAAIAGSGFLCARSVDMHPLRIAVIHRRMPALVIAGALLLLFFVMRKKKPSSANFVLFVAAFIAGQLPW